MNVLQRLKVGTQLAIGFGSVTCIALLLGLLGYYSAVRSSAAIYEIGAVRLPSVQTLLILNEAQTAIDSAENALLSTRLDAAARTAQHQRFVAAKQRIDEAWKIYEPLPQTPEEAKVWKEFVPAWQRWMNDHEHYLKLLQQFEAVGIAEMEAQRSSPLYAQLVHQAMTVNGASFNTAEALLKSLVKINQQAAEETAKDAEQEAARVKAFSSIACAVGVSLTLFLAWIITRIIAVPLHQSSILLNRLAEGDMTQEVPAALTSRRDEIGELARAMSSMTTHLREMVVQVTHVTDQVTAAAHQIAQGSADLAQRTEEQASALEETASSMEELTSTVKQSADHAGQANQLASAARHQAEQGRQVVDSAIAAMAAINQSSRKIAAIIGAIDEIAFQTNLLALNAAVEAARAGEQGRDFAVVAGEVRKLAQRSAEAAKEIKTLITDSVHKVDDGSRLVECAGSALRDIMASVKKVSDIVAEIATATREQASGIEQVNKAILQMDQVTQQNAALVEETASASQSMGEQARELQKLVRFFRTE